VRFDYPTLRKEREGWGICRLVMGIDRLRKSRVGTDKTSPELKLDKFSVVFGSTQVTAFNPPASVTYYSNWNI
jgi:hypothetical protein